MYFNKGVNIQNQAHGAREECLVNTFVQQAGIKKASVSLIARQNAIIVGIIQKQVSWDIPSPSSHAIGQRIILNYSQDPKQLDL